MLIAPPSPAAKLLLNSEFLIVQLDEPTSNAIAPPLDAVLSMNLQLSTFRTPWEAMAPPLPSLFPLINVIPCNVTVAPLATLNILAL